MIVMMMAWTMQPVNFFSGWTVCSGHWPGLSKRAERCVGDAFKHRGRQPLRRHKFSNVQTAGRPARVGRCSCFGLILHGQLQRTNRSRVRNFTSMPFVLISQNWFAYCWHCSGLNYLLPLLLLGLCSTTVYCPKNYTSFICIEHTMRLKF